MNKEKFFNAKIGNIHGSKVKALPQRVMDVLMDELDNFVIVTLKDGNIGAAAASIHPLSIEQLEKIWGSTNNSIIELISRMGYDLERDFHLSEKLQDDR